MPQWDVTQELEEPKLAQLLRVLLADEIAQDPRFAGKQLTSRDPRAVYGALHPIVQRFSQNPAQHYEAILKVQAGDKEVIERARRAATLHELLLKLNESLRRNTFPDLGSEYDHWLNMSK